MRNKDRIRHIKHSITVLQDKLQNIKENANNYEFTEALQELNSVRVNVIDLTKEINKCLK